MKSFKQFINEATNCCNKNEPKEEFIFNSHGSHANIKRKPDILEETKPELGSFEKTFFAGINGYANHKEHKNNMENVMDKLHEAHPHTEEGIKHLHNYTRDSRGLTRDLLKQHISHATLPESSSNEVKGLDTHSFVPAKHDFDTYSGVGFNIHNVKPVGKSKEGNPVYHQPTYMSSSIDRKVPRSFADDGKYDNELDDSHIFHWHHKKSDPVAVIGKHSQFPYEHEVLVPRTESTEHKYHIEHMGTDTHHDQDGNVYKIHHVKRIPESEIIKD